MRVNEDNCVYVQIFIKHKYLENFGQNNLYGVVSYYFYK